MTYTSRLALAVLLAVSLPAAAGSFVSGAKHGVAIQGYDTVAYFIQQDAVKGKPAYAYEWSGAYWFFSSEENRETFSADPEKYAPQYGGHCSLSVANGKSSPGSGDAWTIRNDKLYLNYNKEVRTRWLSAPEENIRFADKKWPGIREKLLAE